MVVEYIRYRLEAHQYAPFEKAYNDSLPFLQSSPYCLGFEFAKGVEEPQNYIVKILWNSIEGHMDGFRKSESFQKFFVLVKPFFSNIVEMKHYTTVNDGFMK